MTRSNRLLNRLILLVVGLVALALAAAAVIAVVPQLRERIAVPSLALTPLVLGVVVAACALVIVLAVSWILTRGAGRTPFPLVETRGEHELAVRDDVVTQLLETSLGARAEVSHVSYRGYRGRRQRVGLVRVTPRRGSDPATVLEETRRALAELDALLGRRLPVVVHLAAGGGRASRVA